MLVLLSRSERFCPIWSRWTERATLLGCSLMPLILLYWNGHFCSCNHCSAGPTQSNPTAPKIHLYKHKHICTLTLSPSHINPFVLMLLFGGHACHRHYITIKHWSAHYTVDNPPFLYKTSKLAICYFKEFGKLAICVALHCLFSIVQSGFMVCVN